MDVGRKDANDTCERVPDKRTKGKREKEKKREKKKSAQVWMGQIETSIKVAQIYRAISTSEM